MLYLRQRKRKKERKEKKERRKKERKKKKDRKKETYPWFKMIIDLRKRS